MEKEILTASFLVKCFINSSRTFMTAAREKIIMDLLIVDAMRRLNSKNFKNFARKNSLYVDRYSSDFYEILEEEVGTRSQTTGPFCHRSDISFVVITGDKLYV